jgi:flagellar protein FliS
MLYDKVVLSLKEAVAAIEAGDIEGRWRANARAMEILNHMWSTLDVENGGEIAQNLENLFSFILMRLPEVDIRNDPEPARDVIGLIEPLRDAWRELARREGAGQPAGPRPAQPGPANGASGALSSTSFSA